MSDEAGDYKAPRWAWWVATGFGSGYLKPAPGTWGSLAAVVIFALLRRLVWNWHGSLWRGWLLYGVIPAFVLTFVGIEASDKVVEETGVKDPGFVVIDEWAGQWIALIPLWVFPSLLQQPRLADPMLLVPFLLFRLFDIWKPGPINRLQRLPKGKGIMADDVLAGIFAGIVTGLILTNPTRI